MAHKLKLWIWPVILYLEYLWGNKDFCEYEYDFFFEEMDSY